MDFNDDLAKSMEWLIMLPIINPICALRPPSLISGALAQTQPDIILCSSQK